MSNYYYLGPKAESFGLKLRGKIVPFNREIVKAVKFLEKKYKFKLFRSILTLDDKGYDFGMVTEKSVFLSTSNIQILFHEVHHVLQRKRGFDIMRQSANWICWPGYKSTDKYYGEYYSICIERDANRMALIDYKEYILHKNKGQSYKFKV